MILATTNSYLSTEGIINTSVVFFSLTIIFGGIILVTLFRKRTAPRFAVYAHGFVAGMGLLLMIIYAVKHPGSYPIGSLILFILAAIGGIYLFSNDLRKRPSLINFAPVHATLAIIAFALLLVFIIGQ